MLKLFFVHILKKEEDDDEDDDDEDDDEAEDKENKSEDSSSESNSASDSDSDWNWQMFSRGELSIAELSQESRELCHCANPALLPTPEGAPALPHSFHTHPLCVAALVISTYGGNLPPESKICSIPSPAWCHLTARAADNEAKKTTLVWWWTVLPLI